MTEPTKHFTEDQVAAAAASGGYCILTVTEADGTVHEHLAVNDGDAVNRTGKETQEEK